MIIMSMKISYFSCFTQHELTTSSGHGGESLINIVSRDGVIHIFPRDPSQ